MREAKPKSVHLPRGAQSIPLLCPLGTAVKHFCGSFILAPKPPTGPLTPWLLPHCVFPRTDSGTFVLYSNYQTSNGCFPLFIFTLPVQSDFFLGGGGQDVPFSMILI